jgi:hypothetical protein
MSGKRSVELTETDKVEILKLGLEELPDSAFCLHE